MLLVAVVLWSKLRWTIPASVMVAPAPLLFGIVLAMQTVKYIIPSAVYEYVDECIWSSFQRTVLTFFSNINGTQVGFITKSCAIDNLQNNSKIFNDRSVSAPGMLSLS